MPYSNCRLLIVGSPSPALDSFTAGMSRRGAQSAVTQSVQEAVLRLGDFAFDVVLASEVLPDGRGYDLMGIVERKGSSLLVGVALSESSLWLPVIENGRRVLGSRALNARMLESELERLFSRSVHSAVFEPAIDGVAVREGAEARRKILERRVAALPLHLSSYDSLDSRRASFDQLTAALAKPQSAGKESRRESGRFERAQRRAALGNRRTS